jgi:chlorobactene glucosyltransferase
MNHSGSVSAIVPARNEEEVIAACIRSLAAQPEIFEIIAVNDQSSDRTPEILRNLASEFPQLRVIDGTPPPQGWLGKNNAVSLGAQHASCPWLLFTDADAVLAGDAIAKSLVLSHEKDAALVSFSPEQVLRTWYEKSLIPFVYLRLAQRFSFDQVNDPACAAAIILRLHTVCITQSSAVKKIIAFMASATIHTATGTTTLLKCASQAKLTLPRE